MSEDIAGPIQSPVLYPTVEQKKKEEFIFSEHHGRLETLESFQSRLCSLFKLGLHYVRVDDG